MAYRDSILASPQCSSLGEAERDDVYRLSACLVDERALQHPRVTIQASPYTEASNTNIAVRKQQDLSFSMRAQVSCRAGCRVRVHQMHALLALQASMSRHCLGEHFFLSFLPLPFSFFSKKRACRRCRRL